MSIETKPYEVGGIIDRVQDELGQMAQDEYDASINALCIMSICMMRGRFGQKFMREFLGGALEDTTALARKPAGELN